MYKRIERPLIYGIRVFLVASLAQWMITPQPFSSDAITGAVAAGIVALLNLTAPGPEGN